jgi:hypothetical protein
MRLFAVFVAICALSQTAIAQTPDCKSIADTAARLACYDRAAPPAAAKSAPPPASADKNAKPASRTPAAKADNSKYVDTIGAEDAKMNARLKNICKGC